MNPITIESSVSENPPIAILGVPFDNVTTAEAIEHIERMVASRRPHYLVTANVDFLVQAREDVELHRILFDAHLVLCDGTPLLWASRLLGNPLPERVAGSDIVPLLVGLAARRKYRLFLLGASPDSASRAVANLRSKYPELIIAGQYSPPFNTLLEMDHEEITRRILEAKPDLLFVSFGCPKQEKWLAMHYRTLGVPVAVGVGATIDFLAGRVRRAPAWMQRSGLEWTFRLAQEPRRLFRRYLKDLWIFSGSIFAQWWRLQFRAHRESSLRAFPNPVMKQDAAPYQFIKIPGRLDLATAADSALLLGQILADGRHCLLEMESVKSIDSTGVGLLIRLQKTLSTAGRQLILVAPSRPVRRALTLMHLNEFFASAPDFADAQKLIEARLSERATVVSLGTLAAARPLQWRGEITAANAEEVWKLTQAYLETILVGVESEIEIDLSSVRFIDSSGLGLMVRSKKLAQRRGAELSFTGVQPAVRNVLHLARLDGFLAKKQHRNLTARVAVTTAIEEPLAIK